MALIAYLTTSISKQRRRTSSASSALPVDVFCFHDEDTTYLCNFKHFPNYSPHRRGHILMRHAIITTLQSVHFRLLTHSSSCKFDLDLVAQAQRFKSCPFEVLVACQTTCMTGSMQMHVPPVHLIFFNTQPSTDSAIHR